MGRGSIFSDTKNCVVYLRWRGARVEYSQARQSGLVSGLDHTARRCLVAVVQVTLSRRRQAWEPDPSTVRAAAAVTAAGRWRWGQVAAAPSCR